ncbi:MAG TPA: hypothetical protein VK662_04870 [Acidothermaceae bacterium]|jgi:hypothetical protein|nr:hypothetical protein [Acidothermaceae bacterium]
MISLALLSGCTAVSHPSALATAAPDSAAAVAIPVSSGPPVSVPASPQISALPSSASASIAGTPTSAAASPTLSPTVLSSNDIAANVRATAQAFFTDLNIAFATGDLTAYNALTSPGCVCRSIAKMISDIYGSHEHITGVTATVGSLNVVSFVDAGASADVHYAISAGLILDPDGKQVNVSPAVVDAHIAMFVLKVRGGWLVTQNTRLN